MAASARRRWIGAVAGAWSAIGVSLIALVMVVAAIVWPGFSVADVQLNDGVVYVVKTESRLSGPLNTQIDELATAVRVADQEFNLLQSGDNVLVQSTSSNQLQEIDFGRGIPGSPIQLPAAATVVQGGDTLAVVDPTGGRMWAGDRATIMAIDFAQAPAQIDLGEGGQATVTTTGSAIGLSIRDQSIVRNVDGKIVKTKLPWQIQAPYQVQLSAVGNLAVVLDRGSQQVWIEGDSEAFEISGGGTAQLAPPTASGVQGSETARAVLANSSGLVGIGRDRLFSLVGGVSAEAGVPLVQDGCAYGVFGNGRFAKACTGQDAQLVDIPEFVADDMPVFRSNRGVVVLNASRVGYIWLVNKGLKLIKDWERVTPASAEQGDKDSDTTSEVIPPNRDTTNRPPTAVDDPSLAARAGRTTMLPVMDNDSDPDGDIITVATAPKTSVGTLSLVRGGTGLQLYLPVTAKGTVSFTYTIKDGRGGTDTATATVKVLPQSQRTSNQAPEQKKNEPLLVALGATASKRVLLDWIDPDGDDLVLISAQMVDSDDEVDFTPEGILNYRDVGTKSGRKEIEVVVSDGVAETRGVVLIEARKGQDIQPVANGDYYSTTVNQEIVLRPLENDVGENLKLARVTREGTTFAADPDYRENSIRFSAKQAGTYYIRYVVTNRYISTGIIRVDVIAPVAQNRPPVAARDVALLPTGGSVLIDPLANDEDPDGDVLVLQSVDQNAALQISMEQRHLLRITAISRPSEPITLNYRVSDGLNSVTGTIVVIPSPSGGKTKPVAVTDEVTVRANDTTTVNVLRNDYSPIGLDLRVDTTLVENEGGAFAWVDGETVRFTAPSVAGQYRVVYRIFDTLGQESSAQVKFNVIATDVENQAPKPELVIGRVLANSTTKIPIPLEGIDPNGDSVRLLGLNSGPGRGRIVSVGERWIEYESYDNPGTDSFEYQVIDSHGLVGVGTIRVGIVPRETDVNTPPVALPDEIRSRPGRQVRLGILANDSDPDGESISLVKDGLDFPFDVQIVGDTDLSFTVPAEPGTYTGQYTLTDARGATTTGVVTVISDTEAPLLAPVTTDDQVLANQVADKTVVDVAVLENDYDPDGDHSGLKLSLPGGDTNDVSIPTGVETPVVRIRIGKTMQLVRYEVTDSDGLKNWGVVVVPGTSDAVPALKADIPELRVVAGDTVSIPIGDYVIGTGGRTVSLVSEDRIWATNGRGTGGGSRTVDFTARGDYVGPGSVVFEVTDGRTPADPQGHKAVVSLAIEIVPRPKADNDPGAGANSLNRPPDVATPITIQVGQGEPEKSINLSQYVSDPDGDPTYFEGFEGNPVQGLDVSFSNDWFVVTVKAAETAIPNSKASWHGLVKDRRHAQAPITIEFVVSESTRPRATVTDDDVLGDQGRPSVVHALANDKSHMLGDTSLTIVGAEIASGRGEVSHTADTVTVTPASDFVGELRVRYTVQDATKSVARQVDGYITVTVRGKPSRPGVVVLETIGNSQLSVNWTAPSANGHPISKYVVTARSTGHSVTQDCRATTCTITGLKNGNVYKLTVVAVNSLGSSEVSAESAEMIPDVKPGTPAAPTLTPADGKLVAHWETPTNEGTAITSYTVQITGDTTSVEVFGRGSAEFNARTYTFTGLTNGARYTVQVMATNQAGDSPFGPGQSEVPAAAPGTPVNVSVSDEASSGDGKKAKVSWQAPADNGGSEITEYVVYANNTQAAVVPGSQTSVNLTLEANGDVSVQVLARNRVGDSPRSAAVSTTIYGAPSTPTAFEISQTPGTGTLVAVSSVSNGRFADGYNIELVKADGTIVKSVTHGSVPWTATGLTGGVEYRFRVQVCAGSKCSGTGTSQPFVATAPPQAPQLAFHSITSANTLYYTWTHSSNFNGAGAPVQLFISAPNVNGGNPVPMTSVLGQSGNRHATVDGPITVTAWAEGTSGGRSRTVTLELDVPMSELTQLGDSRLEFAVHQQSANLTCSVTRPDNSKTTMSVSVAEGSGTGTFNNGSPMAAGEWKVTCGSMERSITVP